MARISEQVEWLNLIDRSGPFLVPAVLEEVFPQGLEKIETPRRQRLRAAYDEWRDAVDEDDPELADLHDVWTRMVIQETLEYEDEVLIPRERLDGRIVYRAPEHGVEIAPDFAVRGDAGDTRLLIAIHPPETDLEKPLHGDRWTASPAERMTLLCRASEVRIGLVTNGEEWMLVNAPIGSTSGYASWFARLWWLEPVTLKAFVSLLGVRRCFGPSEETLDQLLERSIAFQEEVTDTLGEQVRRAVEVLIQALGRADQDRNGGLLKDVRPAELYEAGLTVMMRLVFILCAEERGLLLLGDPVYDQHYAISTLRARLREDESQYGPEVLERRHDAWSRMLAVFRAVYGGVEHETLRMPALGGSLFDPDRFPFLEGRAKGTSWREEPAFPLPIDNRTVLLLLTALQVLEHRGGAQLLSYRALDVEQIGHVYEGLLEYTVAKLPEVTVGLIGSQKVPHPTIGLDELESLHAQGAKATAKHLADITGRSATAIRNSLERGGSDDALIELIRDCGGDETLAHRFLPFVELIRKDSWGSLLIYQAGSFAVTHGADRRETGTHYTPRSLTESIVEKTLEPIVYVGPADGKPREEWMLRPPAELLDLKVCDPAMGSGAFLVQVCRYLAERLVEAWAREEDAGRVVTIDGVVRDSVDDEEPFPKSLDDRLLIAKRLVAERCLYGVDLNPLAVELAKLSIWLVTLAKGRPFGFLDHNLRCGDSLLGIHRLEQLMKLKMNPDDGPYQQRLFGRNIQVTVDKAIRVRERLRAIRVRDIRDVEAMERLDTEARERLKPISLVADAMIGTALTKGGQPHAISSALDSLAVDAGEYFNGNTEYMKTLALIADTGLQLPFQQGLARRLPLHWALEFPEVFSRKPAGFDAVVGNPPWQFLSGKGSPVAKLKRSGRILEANALQSEIEFCCVLYPALSAKAKDRFKWFVGRGIQIVRDGGMLGLLLPSSCISLPNYGDVLTAWTHFSRVDVADLGFGFFSAVVACAFIVGNTKHATHSGSLNNVFYSDLKTALQEGTMRVSLSRSHDAIAARTRIEKGRLLCYKSPFAEHLYGKAKGRISDYLDIREGHHHLSFESGEAEVQAVVDKSMGRFAEPELSTGFLPRAMVDSLAGSLHKGDRFIIRKTGDEIVAAMVPTTDLAVAHQNVYVCRPKGSTTISGRAICALLCSRIMTKLYQDGPLGQKGRIMAQLRITGLRDLPAPSTDAMLQFADKLEKAYSSAVRRNTIGWDPSIDKLVIAAFGVDGLRAAATKLAESPDDMEE